MDFKGQGKMDVDDLAGYMEMCFRVSDPLLKEEKLMKPIQDFIHFKANAHKFPIRKIRFYNWINESREISPNSGFFYTVDVRGFCRYWTHDLKPFNRAEAPNGETFKLIVSATYQKHLFI